jgi:hypothetical protein
MAIATVRRLLRELGYELQPEDPRGIVGPLSLWVAEPRDDLNGLSPLITLALPDGEDQVRQALARMLSTQR